ncbi:MAG: alanine--tRNA ligase [Bacteroidales bacterium]
MNSTEIRSAFLDFFQSKGHTIVPSAPMVIKNDPTLMFTNAGMNQFKDIFLDNSPAKYNRIADSQKCLRVSGKHNDLEEVGRDTYHHTMFEMLGNWSFGDYFKKDAIDWAWEFLTQIMKLDPNRLYATVFEGDKTDKTEPDMEAREYWKKYLPESRILFGNKKDNFWEMGDTGPCGPCSEIHIDLRDETEREKIDGASLVNKDNPLVIEIWNLVFMQFNRIASGELQPLTAKHVDTGMGFERLCMAVQNKKSNYDTDVFQPLIQKLAKIAHTQYGKEEEIDIALRVISDHLRAVSFAIADGQLPSNNGAGYVIRRILRRAIRYGFTFLNFKEPFIYSLVSGMVEQMGQQFPELKAQQTLIEKVIQEEETSFLKTLDLGIAKFENYCKNLQDHKKIDGNFAFELFDTYGFPIDLTQLLAQEKGLAIDMEEFQKRLSEQKNRSRAAATIETDDWVELISGMSKTEFVGYQSLSCESKIIKYRSVKTKGKKYYQLILDKTPFYAESGGQVGDSGILESINEKIIIYNTVKENNLIIHSTFELPDNLTTVFNAKVNVENRISIQNNHSATHLLHHALRKVLGPHVEQKGSLVSTERLRFDFSHFSKVSSEELEKVESMVNKLIRENITLQEFVDTPIEEARKMGAMALFGEKYGDEVRVIRFGDSIELCGGTHVQATGNIGFIKIVSESAIAAGVRRIEAVTGKYAEEYVFHFQHLFEDIKQFFNSPNIMQAIIKMTQDNEKTRKDLEEFEKERIQHYTNDIKNKMQPIEGINLICDKRNMNPEIMKQAAYNLRSQLHNVVIIFGSDWDDKPNLIVAISDDLINKGLNASTMVREAGKLIKGGGGGQPGLATAGGKDCNGLQEALDKIAELVIMHK